jgi:hypothetical protein
MRTIQVPGYGPVKFPESMSDEDIAVAIEKDILPNIRPPQEGVFAAGQGGLKTFFPVHVLVSKQSLTLKVLPVVDLSVAKILVNGLLLARVCNV